MISNDCKNKRANPEGADHRSTADFDLMLLRMLLRVIYHPKASLRLRVGHTDRNQQSRDRANFRQTSRGYSRRTEGRFRPSAEQHTKGEKQTEERPGK